MMIPNTAQQNYQQTFEGSVSAQLPQIKLQRSKLISSGLPISQHSHSQDRSKSDKLAQLELQSLGGICQSSNINGVRDNTRNLLHDCEPPMKRLKLSGAGCRY